MVVVVRYGFTNRTGRNISGPTAPNTGIDTVPKRPFGKTGDKVSILGLGGMFDIPSNQLLLKQSIKWGVTYWDTADMQEYMH